jgi:hypothetical protein
MQASKTRQAETAQFRTLNAPREKPVKKEPTLVDLEQLRKLIQGVEPADPKLNEYINARWLKYVEWCDSRAAKARWKYLSLRSVVVVVARSFPPWSVCGSSSSSRTSAGCPRSHRSWSGW